MKINYEILYFFKYGIEFNLISLDLIKKWTDRLIMDKKVDENFYVFEISTSQYSSEILTLINLELEKLHKTPDLKTIGQSIIGFISKKLNLGQINIDEASSENYKIQLHFLQETEFDLGGYQLDDIYQLARQNIVGDYAKEQQNLKDYLKNCESVLNNFLIEYDL